MRSVVLALCLALTGGAAWAEDVGQPQAQIQTLMGTITIALDRAHAPASVDNFIRYAREGNFDGTVFYRVVPGFVIQMGSYEADGSARPTHEPIALEANNGLSNVQGAVAMAREDAPESATAEFFIDLSDNSPFDHQPLDKGNTTGYAVFGKVVGGMDVVDKIAATPLGGQGPFPPDATPMSPVTIEKVIITDAMPAN